MAETKKAEPKKQSKWDIKEEIYFPRIPGVKEQPDVTVSVNGRDFRIQRGVKVEVPKPVADVANCMIGAQQDADDYYYGHANM